jgi:ribonuclease BN (tRNA processing enzyme)
VSVDVPEHEPILLDIGTGARYFGAAWPSDQPFRGTCLLSHLHWDHIQGLPFFPLLLNQAGQLDIHAPILEDGSALNDVIKRMLHPPLFPVGLDAFPGNVEFHEHGDDEWQIGEVRVMSRLIPHLGNTLGFRLERGGASLAYLSDHQQPGIDVYEATDNARELCQDVDILIHDAQYTRDEFRERCSWGHCTIEYAVWLAGECDVKTLVLYHHDPRHDDDELDELIAAADASTDVNVIGAREGLTLRVGA